MTISGHFKDVNDQRAAAYDPHRQPGLKLDMNVVTK
jgi:hypothetical protein